MLSIKKDPVLSILLAIMLLLGVMWFSFSVVYPLLTTVGGAFVTTLDNLNMVEVQALVADGVRALHKYLGIVLGTVVASTIMLLAIAFCLWLHRKILGPWDSPK